MESVKRHISEADSGVKLTDAARLRILSYLSNNKLQGVRLSVKKTGCSGLSYVIDYIHTKEDSDLVNIIDDEFFICLDKKSYPYLKGIIIDYVKQGINYKFVFQNPNQTGQCGCGESFTVDELP
jgi:iron-sulfur cluster assembly accessory protein